jgi:hypothetical protein
MLKKISKETWILICVCIFFTCFVFYYNRPNIPELITVYILIISVTIFFDIKRKEDKSVGFEPIYTEKELDTYMRYHERQYNLYKSIKEIRKTCKHIDKRPIGNGKFHCPNCCQEVKEDKNE